MEKLSEIVRSIFGKEEELTITKEFRDAFELIESGSPFVFITGRAGTGKSTFVRLLQQKLKSYAIVAPTGVAALNVGGQTIHSFFKLAPGPIDLSKIGPARNKTAYKALKALIIDEVSMVRADLLDAIDTFLQKNGPKFGVPFGGVQIIAVGDLYQLPPIVSSEEEAIFMASAYDSPFFFSANALKHVDLKCIEFSEIFRQKDDSFIQILNNIREGRDLESTVDLLNKRVSPSISSDYDGIVLSSTNKTADYLNGRRLIELASKDFVYEGKIEGEFRVEKSKLPSPFELVLKVGARVMFTKNDRARRWVNGTVGTVTDLTQGSITVEVTDDAGTRSFNVVQESWDNLKYQYDVEEHAVVSKKVGSYTQFPLTLAWAVTIHKSQGKTFDKVHIDLGHGAFAEGQVYVALSRCRTLEGVTLEKPVISRDIFLAYEVIDFHRNL